MLDHAYEVVTPEDLLFSVIAGDIPATSDGIGISVSLPSADEENFVQSLIPESENNPYEIPISNWSNEINNIFALEKVVSTEKKPSKRRLTSHRVLTSDAILDAKRQEKLKKEKEAEEKAKKQKERELKKERKTEIIKATKPVKCFLCKKIKNDFFDDNSIIPCSKCKKKFHINSFCRITRRE